MLLSKLQWLVSSVFLRLFLFSVLANQPMVSQAKSEPARKATAKDNWVRQTLGQLSLKEKVGQLLMPAFRAVYLHSNSSEFQKVERQLKKNQVGGYILFAGDVYEAAMLIDKVQALSKLPLLIASDFERGTNFRIRNTVSFPWNMAIGATGSDEWAYLQGKITGQEARAIGVNWIFAPVVDINNNPANPVINIRSYGEDPELVARMGSAFVRGAQESGVLATGKHFPGHGDTGVDSHLALPVMSMDRQRLEALELIPFKKVIDAGIWSIMTAHLSVPALEPDANTPATLSSRVLRDLLQKDLGFSRLVVTDSLMMAGLASGFWTGDAAVRAMKAGVDVLLDPPNVDVVSQALLDAIERREISRERIDYSVRKILQAKAWLGLHQKRRVDLNRVSDVVNDPKLQAMAQRMADASITLVRDANRILPIDVRRAHSTHVVLVLGRDSQEETGVLEQELKHRIEGVTFSRIFAGSTDSDLEAALEKARQTELVICAAFARVITGTGTVGLPTRLGDWVQKLLQIQNPVVNIALGNPYIIQSFPQSATYLCTFSNADVSQTAAIKAIFGEIPIRGKLPVSLPGVAALRDGIEVQRLAMQLGTTKVCDPLPSRLGKALDDLIPEWIDKRAFPGASVAVGYRGQLAFHKAYGKLDYSRSAAAAGTETIYDLASLTKVITATTLAMQLFDRGQLKLEYAVSRFFPSFTENGRDKITVGHLLTHSSGLPAHLPLYKDLTGKQQFIRKILQVPLEYEPGTKAIYSDLGIILLGDIIEKVAGATLDQLASRQIFQALGMTHTFFRPGASLKTLVAPTENDPWRGRLLQGEVHDENAYAMGGVSAHAGLFGNSGDLAVFCQMLLNGGVYDHRRIVRPSTLEKFTRRQNSPEGSSRALGWDTPSPAGSAGSLMSPSSFGHTGFTGTSIWIDPARELFVVLLTNRVHPTRDNNAIREVRRLVADAVVNALQ
jgi:beta-N-acetylhexosaminidase